MVSKLPSIITQKPITKAMCFDLTNTLTRFAVTPGESLVTRMQKTMRLNELHGTKIPAISKHLESQETQQALSEQFYQTVRQVSEYWPDFGEKDHVDVRIWWKNVVYNVLNKEELIIDPFKDIRDKTDALQIIAPQDNNKDAFAKTQGITVNVFDADFPHNKISFNFDEYFDALYADWCDPAFHQLFPDSRSFINFVYDHYYQSIVLGLATHDSFFCLQDVLQNLRIDYMDYMVSPQNAKCSKPNPKFFAITKASIYESIKRRMVEGEILRLYGKSQGAVYDRSSRIEFDPEHAKERQYGHQELEIRKVYDEYFDQMLGQEDVDILMVGNNIEKDILPALDMGWRAVWLLRTSRFPDSHENFDHYQRHMTEAGIQHFGVSAWEKDVQHRVLVAENLFDIHHMSFLFE
eukprot:CAMPEP_0197056318 /NCGR_PEP_ID=MMETSP1384-20130603/82365_1 /TAXON_ID=29189 /ORGANISM="Ammonia sp." /LENGTH=406 /DNA_ID=CAMNT_0042490243 /DNA_START=14 /DNA_END=1234 /DNA_ORIENTATION=-